MSVRQTAKVTTLITQNEMIEGFSIDLKVIAANIMEAYDMTEYLIAKVKFCSFFSSLFMFLDSCFRVYSIVPNC